jgi:hypothetical protein
MIVEYLHDLEQNTDDWLKHRLGLITGSQVKNLLTPTLKMANNDKTRSLIYTLAAERLTGRIEEIPQTYHMRRGHIEEEIAKKKYSEGVAEVQECGFIKSEKLGFLTGYSPDGLVGDDGLIEIKSRMAKFQIETVCAGEVPSEYMAQIQTAFAFTERKWCDFIQYSNGMPMFVKRVEPDSKLQSVIIEAVSVAEQAIRNLVGEFKIKSKEMIQTEWVNIDVNTDAPTKDNFEDVEI